MAEEDYDLDIQDVDEEDSDNDEPDIKLEEEQEEDEDLEDDSNTNVHLLTKHGTSTADIMDNTLKVVIKPEDEHITQDVLSPYEFAAAKGYRAQQIDKGDEYYVTLDKTDTTAIDIATKEILAGKCPLILERRLPRIDNTIYVEHKRVSKMSVS